MMMRTSSKKLRGFALNRHGEARDRRDPRLRQSLVQFDEITRASQDMQDMRDCYDSLLSAAAATANSAYEFSESLREMGACLLERTALNEDEESGKVLLMLGKLQFELQKIVDNYRSHIFQTITNPSESLLSELRTVEEMKRQCDEKRSLYEYMITRHKEKGRLRNSKEESFSSQQLQSVHDEYDEEATLFVFRLKSLKQGQSRSLLTQAARHHAAQLCFFKKALKSLEAVEPQVKLVTEQKHIDYQFTGLEDNDCDNGDSDDDDDNNDESEDSVYGYDIHDDGELSFDHRQNYLGQNVVSAPKCTVEEILDKYPRRDSFAFERELKVSSQSAPLSADKKFDPAERFRQLRPFSSRNSYVLPTPVERKSSISTGSATQISQTRHASLVGGSLNYRHSSPLEQKKYENFFGNEKLSGPAVLGKQSVLRESNNNATPTSLPPPLAEELSSQQHDQHAPKDTNKIRRYAFSGPLTGNSWSNKPGLSPSSLIISTGQPMLFSGPLLRTPVPQPSSPPKISPSASPPFVSSPKIRELHELPRPPTNLASKFATRPSNQSGYTVPLVSKDQENFAANKFVSSEASALPTPPQTLPRSFSIPSRGQRLTILPGSATRNLEHHKG